MTGRLIALSGLLLTSACADAALINTASDPNAGFLFVSEASQRAAGATAQWAQTPAEIAENKERAHAMVRGKTVGPDTAVQVALLNNRDLQAAYSELGLSAADLWETALGFRPSLGVTITDLGDAGFVRSLEATITGAILELSTQKRRSRIAEIRFRQAQQEALAMTLTLATETRQAWIEAVAAFEAASLITRTQDTADAASELASELGRTGAMNRADQAREHAFAAELAAERADARLAAQLAKEKLTRLMGLYGQDVAYKVPDRLPDLPKRQPGRGDVEKLALEHRTDLAVGRLELEAIAKEYRLANQTRRIANAEMIAGVELERSATQTTDSSPVFEIEFEIPLYDTGKLANRRGTLIYSRAAHALAQRAINARSEARSAHAAVTGKYRIARHWRDEVLPLRRTIDEEALKSYNGMLTSTFDLIADAREGLEAELSTARAKANYWHAEADVIAAIWGAPMKGVSE